MSGMARTVGGRRTRREAPRAKLLGHTNKKQGSDPSWNRSPGCYLAAWADCQLTALDVALRPVGSRAGPDHWRLVAVVLGLVRSVDRHANVVGLRVAELGQFDAQLLQVQPGDFLVQLLGQHVDADRILLRLVPQGQL